MKVIASLSGRTVLASEDNACGHQRQIDCEVGDLPTDARRWLLARLHADKYLCAGFINDQTLAVKPRLDHERRPVLLRLHGTAQADLLAVLEEDQRELIQSCLDQHAAELAA